MLDVEKYAKDTGVCGLHPAVYHLYMADFLEKYKASGLKVRVWTVNKEKDMKKFVCSVCGYVYDEAQGDPDNGVAPGTVFEDIPDSWVCPLCAVGKDEFEPA